MVLIWKSRKVYESEISLEGESEKQSSSNKTKSSIQFVMRQGAASYNADFVLLPPAEEMCSKIPYSNPYDELSRKIMKRCIGKITNGYTMLTTGNFAENKLVEGGKGLRELKVQPFRLLYRICIKYGYNRVEQKASVCLRYFRKQTQKLTTQDKANAQQTFVQWRESEMKSKKYRRIEANHKNRKNYVKLKREDVTNLVLPPEDDTDRIIDEMLLKGCYVSDIFERFGLEFHEE